MGVALIHDNERAEAIASAIDLGKAMIRVGRGFVHPNARVGSLSPFQWQKLAEAVVSGWIGARSRQLIAERFYDENEFLATGLTPEPYELATCSFALPALGSLVEHMGLTDVPIGQWAKQDVLLFVWSATELVNSARTIRDERPGPANSVPDEIAGRSRVSYLTDHSGRPA